MPVSAQIASRGFFRLPASEMEPSSGHSTKASKAAEEVVIPSQKVLSVGGRFFAQYSLRNTGKKAAITVVAKAELATS
jgi:hypothetical protein